MRLRSTILLGVCICIITVHAWNAPWRARHGMWHIPQGKRNVYSFTTKDAVVLHCTDMRSLVNALYEYIYRTAQRMPLQRSASSATAAARTHRLSSLLAMFVLLCALVWSNNNNNNNNNRLLRSASASLWLCKQERRRHSLRSYCSSYQSLSLICRHIRYVRTLLSIH
jgi:hypothetical protein